MKCLMQTVLSSDSYKETWIFPDNELDNIYPFLSQPIYNYIYIYNYFECTNLQIFCAYVT